MVNRESWQSAVDVPGYDHTIKNNVCYDATTALYQDINQNACTIKNNTFLPINITLTDDDFECIDGSQLKRERKADGSLPEITFLKLKPTSTAYKQKMGYQFTPEESTEVEDNDISGIRNTITTTTENKVFYSIQGIRTERPTHGLYIVNGRKTVIK